MKDFSKNLIHYQSDVILALKKLNDLPLTLTLFVIDDEKRLLGTTTDGDIRRGFIRGLQLTDRISAFMKTDFHAAFNTISINEFKKAKELGVKLLPVLDENKRIVKVINITKRKSNLPLEAIIMAGGRGERLLPLTSNKPKPMLDLGGKPIIEHNINRLISFGIEKIYISVNYLGQQIVDFFGDGSSKGISIEYIREDKPLGTAGALSLLRKFNSEYLLLMNSDLFTDADFEDLYFQVINNNAELGVASVPYTVKVPYGIFVEDAKNITELKEKPVFTNYANAGIYILHKNLLNLIPPNKFFDITDLMNLMIAQKRKLIHNPIVGYWIDIGQPQDYENAREIVKHLKDGN